MTQRKSLYFDMGETKRVENEWAAEVEQRDTTISSSTWAFTDEGSVAGASLTGTLASALLTPQCSGVLTNTVVLADGETLKAVRAVEVTRYC